MNLHDIVKRRDSILVIEAGHIEPAQESGPNGYLGARIAPGTRFKLSGMPERKTALGWRVIEGNAEIDVRPEGITVSSNSGAVIRSSGHWKPRSILLPFAVGDGIEVGPGVNPHVKPSEKTSVRYLESADKDEWLLRYHLRDSPEMDVVWANYLEGDAQTLEQIEEGSLDFIYSSHVFEHLMNPLGVLRNWAARLKEDGSVLAVIPDCRNCFDLRQEPSTMAEIESELAEGKWKPDRAKFEKWCAGTALGSDPDELIERGYPIHFHYYTPSIFAAMAGKIVDLGMFSQLSLWTERNAKDFAVRLVK